jgi:hypothetical protein
MLPYFKIPRDYLLQATDWTQLPDVDLTQEQKDAWAAYRQSLREVTMGSKWPTPPEKIIIRGDSPWWLDMETRMEINL